MAFFNEWERSLAVGVESTWGAVGTISEWIAFEEATFNLEIPFEDVPGVWQRRGIQKTYQKSKVLTPALKFDVEPENGLGCILKSAFGTVNSVQYGTFVAYKHTYQILEQTTLPSLWTRIPQIGTTTTKDYVGLNVSKLTINFGKDENVKADVSFIGKDELTGTATTGTYSGLAPLSSFGELDIKIDGTSNTDIANGVVNIDNQLTSHIVAGTNKTISKISANRISVDGNFDLYFQNQTERNKFINKNSSTLQFLLTGTTFTGTAKYELNFKLPNVEYISVPFESKDGLIGATIGFKALYGTGNSVGTGVILAELQNSKVAY